jgi:hypothetical protein
MRANGKQPEKTDTTYHVCGDNTGENYCFHGNMNHYSENIDKIVKIQSIWRRKYIRATKDGFTKQILENMIDEYARLYAFFNNINKKLKFRKIRLPNYPSEITENLVKFAITRKYNVSPCWDTKKGDLYLYGKRLEVKGSLDLMGGGPSSFGPKEKWDRIYFVDAVDHSIKKFKIYEIKLSNRNETWKNIKINKNQTYHEQCLQKRRPRIRFAELIKQIPKNSINTIFNGFFSDL